MTLEQVLDWCKRLRGCPIVSFDQYRQTVDELLTEVIAALDAARRDAGPERCPHGNFDYDGKPCEDCTRDFLRGKPVDLNCTGVCGYDPRPGYERYFHSHDCPNRAPRTPPAAPECNCSDSLYGHGHENHCPARTPRKP